jgi:outer membrane protein assembly factor BamB
MSPTKTTLMATTLMIGSLPLLAADWPNYRGPGHDGISKEKLVSTTWAAGGPRQLWKIPASGGFSSLTVAGGRAFTTVSKSIDGANREVLLALDAASGKELWNAPLSVAKFDGGGNAGTKENSGGDGPRSTPTIDGDRVYVLDGRLVLACWEAASGKEVWRRDLIAEHAGRNITWQNAASPLIEGNLVFVAGGGEGQSLLAIDRNTGKTVWKGENDRMTHATPVLATLHGEKQVIFFTQTGLVAVRPADGSVLWRQGFRYSTSTAASPVVAGDIVYCSAGYGVGAGAYRISKDAAGFKSTELWRAEGKLQNHWSTPVYRDGHLYGMFGFKEYGSCPLKCVELSTGKEKWAQPGFGPGNVTLVDGHLIALSDQGELVMVQASPEAYRESARADVLEGKCWSTPTYSGGRIFARSTKEAVCVELSQGRAAVPAVDSANPSLALRASAETR